MDLLICDSSSPLLEISSVPDTDLSLVSKAHLSVAATSSSLGSIPEPVPNSVVTSAPRGPAVSAPVIVVVIFPKFMIKTYLIC